MTKGTRRVILAAVVTVWTTLAYSAIFALGLLRVDPIRFVPGPRPEFLRHGMPIVSSAGALVWLAVLAIYACGSILFATRILGITVRQRRMLGTFVALLSFSVAFVALVHPMFLLTILTGESREAFAQFVQLHVPFLDQIYFHWGLHRLKYAILSFQVLATLGILALVLTGATARLQDEGTTPANALSGH